MFASISPINVLYGFFEFSHMGAVVFRGSDVRGTVQNRVTWDVAQLEMGQGPPCNTCLSDEERVALSNCTSEKTTTSTRITCSLAPHP